MAHSLADLAGSLLKAAASAGADAADVLAVDGRSINVDVRDGKLEQAERSEGVEVGLRVLVGRRQACVSSSLIDPGTFATMAERAVFMAREAPEDPHIGLADPAQLATQTDATDLELWDPTPEPDAAILQEDARRAEAAALAVSGISQVQAAGAYHGTTRLHLATSGGFSAGYTRSARSIQCTAITGEGTGMERDYDYESRVFEADLPEPETVGKRAAERTIARAGARKPKTGAYPVVFDYRVSSGLIGHLVQAINGAMIARGSSWLKDALGEQVLPKGMDLIEDPHRPRIAGSKLFDGEGLATRKRSVVQDGILQGWTLDLATARKLGMESTANAARGTSSPPSPVLSNLTLTPGDKSLEEMLRDMGTGLLVTSMIGATINPNTGDYSRGASGFWIENGELAYPINECTLAGNLRDMLMTIRACNDGLAHYSRVIPSLAVEGLVLAGE